MEAADYSTLGQRDHVLILGGGPSTNANRDRVVEYYNDHDPVVLSPHYEHYIPSDYLVFTKRSTWQAEDFKCQKFILGMSLAAKARKMNRQVLLVKHLPKEVLNCLGKTNVDVRDGIANAGFTSMLISLFFRPKEVLICGFDGPDLKTYGSILKFDGSVSKYAKEGWDKKRKRKVRENHRIIECVSSMTTLKAFASDNLWGASKKGVSVI